MLNTDNDDALSPDQFGGNFAGDCSDRNGFNQAQYVAAIGSDPNLQAELARLIQTLNALADHFEEISLLVDVDVVRHCANRWQGISQEIDHPKIDSRGK